LFVLSNPVVIMLVLLQLNCGIESLALVFAGVYCVRGDGTEVLPVTVGSGGFYHLT
jgi:hypothetical protein